MQRYEIHLIADQLQFCLQDDDMRYGDLSGAWTPEAEARLVALAPHAIGVGTTDDGEVAVTVEVHEEQPEIDARRWERIEVAHITIDTGQVVVVSSSDTFADAFRIRVRPGDYVAQVGFGEGGYLVAFHPASRS